MTAVGDIVIARIRDGRRGSGTDLSPCETYARVIAVGRQRIVIDVYGVEHAVHPADTRTAPAPPSAKETP